MSGPKNLMMIRSFWPSFLTVIGLTALSWEIRSSSNSKLCPSILWPSKVPLPLQTRILKTPFSVKVKLAPGFTTSLFPENLVVL